MSSRKLTVVGLLGLAAAVLAASSRGQVPSLDSPVAPSNVGDPLPNVTAAERLAFQAGLEAFEEEEEAVADGLGPVFNENSCVACHNVGATGGGSTRLETRFGRTVKGVFDPLDGSGASGLRLGGSLMQDQGIGLFNGVNFVAEVVPKQANTVAKRRTTPLFGLGLVDNVPDAVFDQIALFQPPAIRGTVNRVFDPATGQVRVGRFGWKAQVATLRTFSADAYLNEMGITTPPFPASGVGFINENPPQGQDGLLAAHPGPRLDPTPEDPDGCNDDGFDDIDAFTDFMTFLGPPPVGAITDQVKKGAELFLQVGCAKCHIPVLQTGPNQSAALDQKTFFPFSDFLLHNMGSLNDGIAQGGAGANQMRTAPLWGVRLQTTLLHDGSATTIPGAILKHDGQGKAARDAFSNLTQTQKDTLVAFLKAL